MPRQDVIRRALESRGALIMCATWTKPARISNHIAPEHLEFRGGAAALGQLITPAPCSWAVSTESLGDYCAGPNHVLPTSRTARFSSPLGVYDFQKRSSVIEVRRRRADVRRDRRRTRLWRRPAGACAVRPL